MKKISRYILIIIILIEIFSPIFYINAQTIRIGTCVTREGNLTTYTFENCVTPNKWEIGGYFPPSKTEYFLLAPLPCKEGYPGCIQENGVWTLRTFDPVTETDNKNTALGAYLNMMIRLFIGICAILAVIMIVMGGVEYMTSELISSKEAGKERILNALFGLVLALGSWTLLYTINPSLLNTDLESLKPATLVNEGEIVRTIASGDGGTIPTGATTDCASGLKRTTSGMVACNSIAANIDKMINAAFAASPSLRITGGGYRSPAEQFALRTENCGAVNENNPNARCTTLTALPGLSRHQNGLAFDLKCNGKLIENYTNPCFVWLRANANSFGLFAGLEPWHWSTDGR